MTTHGIRAQMDTNTRGQAESVVKALYEAVIQLCVGKGDVRDRLKDAAATLIPLSKEDFPAHLQDAFVQIRTQVSKYKSEIPGYEGDIDATMKRIKNSTGQQIAERIFHLYEDIQEIRGFPLLGYRPPED